MIKTHIGEVYSAVFGGPAHSPLHRTIKPSSIERNKLGSDYMPFDLLLKPVSAKLSFNYPPHSFTTTTYLFITSTVEIFHYEFS